MTTLSLCWQESTSVSCETSSTACYRSQNDNKTYRCQCLRTKCAINFDLSVYLKIVRVKSVLFALEPIEVSAVDFRNDARLEDFGLKGATQYEFVDDQVCED